MSIRHRALTRFGLNVRRRREAVGLSQEALAEKADLDRTYISGIERGIRNPTVLSAARVATGTQDSARGTCSTASPNEAPKFAKKRRKVAEDSPAYGQSTVRRRRFDSSISSAVSVDFASPLRRPAPSAFSHLIMTSLASRPTRPISEKSLMATFIPLPSPTYQHTTFYAPAFHVSRLASQVCQRN